MILRRITEHVREQNWTAVFLDFLIVVVGVFIGIQVSNWNDARHARQVEMETLLRLHDEAVEIVAQLQWKVEGMGHSIAEAEKAVAALFAHKPGDPKPEGIDIGLLRMLIYPAITPNRAVYDEQVSAGLATSISDPAVREALANYYSELDFAQSQLAFFRTGSRDYLRLAGTDFIADYDPDSQQRLSVNFDMEAIAQNRAFKTEAASALRNQLTFQNYRIRLLENANKMCAELSRVTEKPCVQVQLEEAAP